MGGSFRENKMALKQYERDVLKMKEIIVENTNFTMEELESQFEKEQDFYRDLGMGLTRSTRKAEARKTSFESLSKEELVSLVGSVILGQKNHFDVTTPQQTSMWKERLRKYPSYTKQVLSSADVASQIIMQRIDILKKGGNQDIDLRSSTPVEVDIDGNGIVESQENLAPDQKQSSNESQEQSDEVPRQEKRHMHR